MATRLVKDLYKEGDVLKLKSGYRDHNDPNPETRYHALKNDKDPRHRDYLIIGTQYTDFASRRNLKATVKELKDHGAVIQFEDGYEGFMHNDDVADWQAA